MPRVSFGVGAGKAPSLEELRQLLGLKNRINVGKRGISQLHIAGRTDLLNFLKCFDGRLPSKQRHLEILKAELEIQERRPGSGYRLIDKQASLDNAIAMKQLNKRSEKGRGRSIEEIMALKQSLTLRPKKPKKKRLFNWLIAKL